MTAVLRHSSEAEFATDEPFDLREYVTRGAEGTSDLTSLELAWKLIRDMTDRERRLALAELLPRFVAVVVDVPQVTVAHPAGRPTTASRVASWYEQTMTQKIYLNGKWKYLADCTASDLHNYASERYQNAARLKAEADQLVTLAVYLEDNGLRHVGQITELHMKELIGGAR